MQQVLDGGAEDVMAAMHELSCKGLHVTAFAISGASNRSMATTAIAQSTTYEAFFILNFFTLAMKKEREREKIGYGTWVLDKASPAIYRSSK